MTQTSGDGPASRSSSSLSLWRGNWNSRTSGQATGTGVPRRIHRFGLPVGIELKHLRGKSLAHRITHAHVVVYPDAQFTCHDTSLIPGHRQGFERTESDAGLICEP